MPYAGMSALRDRMLTASRTDRCVCVCVPRLGLRTTRIVELCIQQQLEGKRSRRA